MRLRSDEDAPLRRAHLDRLPSLDQQSPDLLADDSETSAFRAALHGLTPNNLPEEDDDVTRPLDEDVLPPPRPTGMTRPQNWMPLRRMAGLAVALLVLLGVTVPVLGSHLELVAFMVGAAQNTATPTPLSAGGAQAGAVPLPTTPTPLPKNLRPITVPPTPTPIPTSPPYSTNGPYGNYVPPPGYSSFAVTEPSPDPWASSFGECTWWAQYKRQDEDFIGFGAAENWASEARAHGMTVTSTPVANATVVFAPGVQGASSSGHVAHVEKILTGGWVLVSEMNFYWNGGGFARVDYRYIHVGTGVWFIH